MAVRAIAKACEAYKRDKTLRPTFRPDGAVAYDQRILSRKGRDSVSILTLDGRIIVPVVAAGTHHLAHGAVRVQTRWGRSSPGSRSRWRSPLQSTPRPS
jgi:hypothetical protein